MIEICREVLDDKPKKKKIAISLDECCCHSQTFFCTISSTTKSSISAGRTGLSIIPCRYSYREIFWPVDRCFVNGV